MTVNSHASKNYGKWEIEAVSLARWLSFCPASVCPVDLNASEPGAAGADRTGTSRSISTSGCAG